MYDPGTRLARLLTAGAILWSVGEPLPADVTVTPSDTNIEVRIDGELFTQYVFTDCENPYLYPIIGPHGIRMTRDFPMRVVSGESHDHEHHRSMWFAQDGMNGVDFWRNAKPGHGVVRHEEILRCESGRESGFFRTTNRWLGPDGKLICRDIKQVTCWQLPTGRAIDWTVTLIPSEDGLQITDSEEGTMAIRTHTNLQLVNQGGTTSANGQAVNSEGVRGAAVWGKRAAWVDYWGTVDGHVVGIAIFDHSSNPRHPTWWMARDYGLVAANPFGIHDFEGKPPGTGDMQLKAGEPLRLRYRFLFHDGGPDAIDLPAEFQRFQGAVAD